MNLMLGQPEKQKHEMGFSGCGHRGWPEEGHKPDHRLEEIVWFHRDGG